MKGSTSNFSPLGWLYESVLQFCQRNNYIVITKCCDFAKPVKSFSS